jgi:hypothetical protein
MGVDGGYGEVCEGGREEGGREVRHALRTGQKQPIAARKVFTTIQFPPVNRLLVL